VWTIVYIFHIPPSQVWEMGLNEFYFWLDGVEYVIEQQALSMMRN